MIWEKKVENRYVRGGRVHRVALLRSAAGRGTRGDRAGQPDHGIAAEPGTPGGQSAVRVSGVRRYEAVRDRGAGGRLAASGVAGESERLLRPPDRDAGIGVDRDAQHAGARAEKQCALFVDVDFGMLWRSAGASAGGDVLGQRESGGAALLLRRE